MLWLPWLLRWNWLWTLVRIICLWWVTLLLLVSRSSLCLAFHNLMTVFLDVDLFEFIPLGICWACCVDSDLSQNLGNCWSLFLQIIFLPLPLPLLLGLPLCTCWCSWWCAKAPQVLFTSLHSFIFMIPWSDSFNCPIIKFAESFLLLVQFYCNPLVKFSLNFSFRI